MSGPVLRLATRASVLARWQTDHVAGLLGQPTETVVVETAGDRRTDLPIWQLGGQGVFVKEVQAAVLEGRADLAVHSAKDLPSTPTPGLALAAVPERGDPRDALVGSTLDQLAPGAVVATGSVRRRAQLAWLRPDLCFTGLRGSIATRMGRVPPGGAIVVAAAALARLGLQPEPMEVLDPSVMLPQVSQGALAVECRVGDARALRALAAIDHLPSRQCIGAERAFLAELGGACDLPVGAYARAASGPVGGLAGRPGPPPGLAGRPRPGHGRPGPELDLDLDLELEVLLATLDGRVLIRRHGVGPDPEALGRALALQVLDGCGGRHLLEDLGRPASSAASPPRAALGAIALKSP